MNGCFFTLAQLFRAHGYNRMVYIHEHKISFKDRILLYSLGAVAQWLE